MHEAEEAVALVSHGGAQVAIEVVFGVVHHDVVHVVGIGCFTEEGTEHPWDVVVEEPIFSFEQCAVARVVQHEDKGA